MSGETTVWKTVVLYPWLMGIKQGGFLSACTPKHYLVNISLLEVGCFDTSPLGSPVSKLVEILWQREREPKNQINLDGDLSSLLSTPSRDRLHVARVDS